MLRSGAAWLGLVLAAASAGPPSARAESRLQLAIPASYGSIPAASYDDSGQRIGDATLVLEKLATGNVRIFSESGIQGGVRTVASAELSPIDGSHALRLVTQESRTFLADGAPLGVLTIDHGARVARCRQDDETAFREIPLPEVDRVANVPLNLLFLPLVQGDAESIRFQLFLCRGERPRFLDFEATVVRRDAASNGDRGVVEVRYGPDLGRALSLVARHFVPRLSFWFDPDAPTPWLGHRIPLYSSGPEITVIRDGVPPALLNGAH